MKAIIAAVVAVVLGLGAWYYLMQRPMSEPAAPNTNVGANDQNQTQTSSSGNDANMPDDGVIGADGAEGMIIGSNLALGTDGNATLGAYLIGYTGRTVYTYTKDTGSVSTCYDTCATNWPPYIVGAEDNVKQVKSGVNASKVGTTVRTDGSIQMTYGGKPLYFYVGDKMGGYANGQGVGGVWFVVKP